MVQIVKFKAELENVKTFSIPEDHEWCFDIVIPSTGEVRENVKFLVQDEVEVPNSRGIANLVIKVDRNVHATLTVESLPKIIKSEISSDDSGSQVPVLAVDCRGCEIQAWKPTGFYTVIAPSGTRFEEVELESREWYDVDPETNEPVSITNVETSIDAHRK